MIGETISQEIGEDVVTYPSRSVYWVPDKTDVSDLPNVGGYSPIPDPNTE